MPKLPWAAVLFDLDGTVADTIGLILKCYRHTMKTHLGQEPPDDAWIRGMGTPLRQQLAVFGRTPEEVEAMAHTYVTLQREIHDDMVSAYPGVPEMLAALEAAGVPMALVTSRRPEMLYRTLDRCALTRFFTVIVTPDDVTHPKPDPEPVQVALERLGSPAPDRVLFLGDSPHDILSGRGAGVRTVGVLWGPFPRAALEQAGADYLIERPMELLALRP